MNEHNIFYFLILLLILILENKAENIPEIHFIISGTLNGTASFFSLENVNENEKYLYFAFDFEFHSKSVHKNENIAYFLISSELDLVYENSNKEKIK